MWQFFVLHFQVPYPRHPNHQLKHILRNILQNIPFFHKFLSRHFFKKNPDTANTAVRLPSRSSFFRRALPITSAPRKKPQNCPYSNWNEIQPFTLIFFRQDKRFFASFDKLLNISLDDKSLICWVFIKADMSLFCKYARIRIIWLRIFSNEYLHSSFI